MYFCQITQNRSSDRSSGIWISKFTSLVKDKASQAHQPSFYLFTTLCFNGFYNTLIHLVRQRPRRRTGCTAGRLLGSQGHLRPGGRAVGVLATALLPPPPRRTDTGLQGLLRISMAHFHSIFKKSALGPRQKENGKLLQELTFKSQPRTEKAVHDGAVFTVGLGPTFLFFRFFL